MSTAASPWLWQRTWERGLPPELLPPIKLNRLWPANEPFLKPRAYAKRRTDMTEVAAETPGSNLPAVPEKKSTALAIGGGPVAGLEDLQARDLIVPDLKLGQGTTREEGVTAGKYYSSLDPSEQRDKIRLVALRFGHGQVFFPRDSEGEPIYDAPLTCGSRDGRVPSPDIENPISPRCRDEKGVEVCPSAKWTKDSKPACQETHTFIVVDLETGVPYRLSLKSTDLSTSKKFISNVSFRARAKGLALYDFEFTLGTTKVQTKKGNWYGVTFTELVPVEKDKHRELFETYAHARGADEKAPEATGSVVDAANKAAAEEKKPAKKSGKNRELDF